jgi:hypothetical protein
MDFESMIKDKDANIIRVEEGRLCTSCNNNVQMKVLAISNEVVDDEDKLLYTHDVYFPICGDCYALNMSDVYIHENLKSADDAYRKHFDIGKYTSCVYNNLSSSSTTSFDIASTFICTLLLHDVHNLPSSTRIILASLSLIILSKSILTSS